VTNALRYGEAPVRVRAEQAGRHLRMTDEDEGARLLPRPLPAAALRALQPVREPLVRPHGARALGLAIAE
jgi:hypothetical protein